MFVFKQENYNLLKSLSFYKKCELSLRNIKNKHGLYVICEKKVYDALKCDTKRCICNKTH